MIGPVPSWEILRVRSIIRHTSPSSRTVTREYTLRNLLETANPYIGFFEDEPRADFHVHDDAGAELPVMPRSEIIAALKGSSRPEDNELGKRIESGAAFYPVVLLPSEPKIPKNQVIVITCSFRDTDKANESPRGPLSLFFNIPVYDVDFQLTGGERYTSHVVVVAPEGFDLRQSKACILKQERKAHPNQESGPLPDESWMSPPHSRGVYHFSIPQGE